MADYCANLYLPTLYGEEDRSNESMGIVENDLILYKIEALNMRQSGFHLLRFFHEPKKILTTTCFNEQLVRYQVS